MELNEFFKEHPKVALAFSGGVDSAYLLFAAKKYAENVQAYYVKSDFQPQFELDDAVRLANELSVPMKVIPLNVLEDENIASNPSDRCYYCKKRIFSAITQEALKDGFSVLIDGTNASDKADDRPGMKALSEMSVKSPLRLCGITKAEVRNRSKEAGLFTWDKPAYACLATRIPTGQIIDKSALRRTEESESFLSSMGFADFRIRTVGESAKIQILDSQFDLLLENREKILKKLSEKYSSVCLDLEGRHEQ